MASASRCQILAALLALALWTADAWALTAICLNESPRVVVQPASRFDTTPPEPGSWAWLLDRAGPASLVVDSEGWQRMLGSIARDPIERPVLAEILESYRRRVADAVERFESTVAPGIDRAQRREWYMQHRGGDPSLSVSRARAHRTLRRDELAAIESLASDTVDFVLGRASVDGAPTDVLLLRDGGESAPVEFDRRDLEHRARLVARVRDELIIAARLRYLRPMSLQGIAGVGEKLDPLIEIEAFLDRHDGLVRTAAAGGRTAAKLSSQEIRRHLSPHRAELARQHLRWRDAFANITRSSEDDTVDTAHEWRTVRRAMLDIGLLNDALAQQMASVLRTRCVDGETVATTWLREWRIRASEESVPMADAFETALAWIEATDAVATEQARSSLRQLRREHDARRTALDEAIMRARFDRLRCATRADDPADCPTDGIVAAEAALEEAALRRVDGLRGLIT